jgi:leader peptidase (prepilin peptidase) / N-methyltransferase
VLYIAFFILGSLWGSFSNVCIYRLPNDGNVAKGRSFCPNCKNKIKWFDNIPFFSYLFLKGKCRQCSKPISFQYFIVELLTAISFVLIFHIYGASITTLLLLILSIFFIIIFFIDLKHFIIPNVLTFPLMVIGFLKSFDPNLNQTIFPNYINSLIGGLFGYSIIWSIIFFYKKIRKKEGMGLGDAKLMAVIGFWFGWVSIPFTIFISSVVALILVIPSLINQSRKMSSEIPFGPYIIIGCILYVTFANQIKYFLF